MQGENALVTGASRGIGRAIALALAENGAYVTGTATTQEGAQQVGTLLNEAGLQGAGETLQLQDPESVSALLARLSEQGHMPTILVNNAGITRDNLLLRMKDEEWDDVLSTNLRGVFQLTRGCLRGMLKARHGRIISLSSVVAFIGNPGQTNYASTKAGLIGFTRALAQEVGMRGITANCVAPGFIETDMTRALSDEQQGELRQRIPLQRLGTAEDVAAAVLYLAGEGGGYITGETLHVNGGMFMG
ncbi:MAG: 3-oxoacyl-ACP reductase FabG [Gammaproteobacteria bacterium]|nr:3-oxoacyl-ACP reductase FabG [Gammaproteobacteria bacterium]